MQQIATKLTLEALGVDVKLQEFDERLIVQKAIYLAQAAGVDRGYFFRWYLRGPYSPELTRDVFGIRAEIVADPDADESQDWALDGETIKRLNKVACLVPAAETASKARKLELLASVHFLVSRRQVPTDDVDALVQLLRRYGKDFLDREVADALSELRDNGLLS